MSRKAIGDVKYEAIKNHILDPENSPLSPEHQFQLDRLVSAAKLLERYPIKKHAVAIHRKKYPTLGITTAYQDLADASKLYNSFNTFDYDFWQNWMLQDITENIRDCRKTGTAQDRKTIAQEHANLMKAIGEKPSEAEDPTRHEKNAFYLTVNLGKDKNMNIDLENLDNLPKATLRELNKVLFAGNDITDVEAEEIMNS